MVPLILIVLQIYQSLVARDIYRVPVVNKPWLDVQDVSNRGKYLKSSLTDIDKYTVRGLK